jgi:hypothetical protein
MRLTLLAPIGPLILEQSTLGEMKVNLKSLLSGEQNKGLVFITLIKNNIQIFFSFIGPLQISQQGFPSFYLIPHQFVEYDTNRVPELFPGCSPFSYPTIHFHSLHFHETDLLQVPRIM